MSVKNQRRNFSLILLLFFSWGCSDLVIDIGPLIVRKAEQSQHDNVKNWGTYRYEITDNSGKSIFILYSNKKFNVGDKLTIDVLNAATAEMENSK